MAALDVKLRRADLQSALQLCASVVDKRSVVPILANVKLVAEDEALTLVATDLDLTIRTSRPAAIRVPGSTLIDAAALLDTIRRASAEEVLIQALQTGTATISVGEASYKTPTRSAEDFPQEPDTDGPVEVEYDAAQLMALLDATSYAATTDTSRFQLNGVLLNVAKKNTEAAATDGHRLAVATLHVPNSAEAKTIIPAKCVRAIERLSGETIKLTIGTMLVADDGTTQVIARLTDVNFPDYRNFIPKLSQTGYLDRATAADAVRRVLAFSSEKTRCLKFHFEAERLTVRGRHPERGEATDRVLLEYVGPSLPIGLDGNYMAQALEAIDAERVELQFENGVNPIVLRPHGNEETPIDTVHVVMPMRLGEGE